MISLHNLEPQKHENTKVIRPEKYFMKKIKAIVAAVLLLLPASTLFSQGNWYINGSLQMVSGKYIYDESTSSYTLYGGIRYQTTRWYASADFSVFAQSSELVSRGGDMFLPGNQGQSGNGMHSGSRGMMTNGSTLSGGLGDIFLRGEYTFLTERNSLPSVSLNGMIKIPVAHTSDIYGTGEFDFGLGIALRKQFGQYALFTDIGYITLGDPEDYTYNDPVTYGFGVGRFFQNGQYSVLAYIQGYSKILSGYDPPRQVSLGFNIRTSTALTFSITGSYGFSETSPDAGVSGGITVAL